MPCAKAVIFDFIGTLVNCRNYTIEASRQKLHKTLVSEGFDVKEDEFLSAYILAHEKYRKIRYEQLREVTNAVWVAEALNNIGFKVGADDSRIKAALNVFFREFVDTLEVREGTKNLLRQVKKQCKVALISNFTYAPTIYKSLQKTGISEFFNVIVISEDIGWRKPSGYIFQETLNRLSTKATEVVYVGDNPIEDIKGAKQIGLKTVFVPSQFNTLKDLLESQQRPDFIAKDLQMLLKNLAKILNLD